MPAQYAQIWRSLYRDEALRQEFADAPPGVDDGPLDLLIQQEQEAEFMNVLGKLPDAHRSVLLLHFIEEFSLEEIAEITGAQLGTVKSRMHYAKKALRKLLENHENPA